MSRWKHYNPNPSGRNVGDCSVRAVAAALDIDWETAYALIAKAGYLMNDVISSNSVFGAVLRQHGFYRHILPNSCPDCYTLEDFAEDHPQGVYVAGMGNHVATVKDGMIWDSWNSSNEIPIYYWSKRKDER